MFIAESKGKLAWDDITEKKNLSDEHQVLLSGVHPGSNFKDCVLPNWNSQIVCDPHFRVLR